ncbi:protein containing von Willebrand factor type A (vWA) domain [gamma proteobacterium HIMB55]|nr:protein containing von Willebrand factor type A (vWA) domain [gamma proteobacterium HIMB55]
MNAPQRLSQDAPTDRLLAFIEFLRGRDIFISPADSLVAMEVAGLVGYANRQLLKDGLGSALAKSKFEIEIFNEAFEQYFGVPEDEKPKTQNSESKDASESEQPSPEQLGQQLAQALEAQPELSKNLSSDLVEALKSGDEAAIAIAVETAAQQVDVSAIKLLTQRGQYIRKMLDALGEQALRDAAVELESTEPAAFEAVQALREQLRNKVRDRVDRAYMVHASGDAEDMLDEALSNMSLGNVDQHHRARLKRLLEKMTRKLAARHGRIRKRVKRGQLAVPPTLRKAMATDGVPFKPQWRKSLRRKPQILILCDVSGSVAAYAKFLLLFVHSLQDILPRTRSFAFSSNLGEVTETLRALPVETAIERVNLKYGGATDYARAFEDFADLAMADINRVTTVIVLGDARNNNTDPRLDLLAEIRSKCRQLIWLNPESQRSWSTGDSEMAGVMRNCDVAAECSTLKQLERVIDTLLTELNS